MRRDSRTAWASIPATTRNTTTSWIQTPGSTWKIDSESSSAASKSLRSGGGWSPPSVGDSDTPGCASIHSRASDENAAAHTPPHNTSPGEKLKASAASITK